MKKIIYLMFILLFAAFFVSCTKDTPEQVEVILKPGDKICNITVEEHSMSTKYPDLWDYCAFQPEEKEPGIQTVDCEVPLITRMSIYFGWTAKDTTILDTNFDAMEWELFIDGNRINLDEFGQWDERVITDITADQKARLWILDLNNLSPGKHILRYLWTSDISINDGYDIYAPGTYEHIVNFTVQEK